MPAARVALRQLCRAGGDTCDDGGVILGRALCVGLLCLAVTGCGDDAPSSESEGSTTTEDVSSCDERMIVYFNPTASDDEVARALPSIESFEGVVKAEAVTHDETLAEFREIFSENSELVETVTAEMLPASIRVRLDEGSSLDEVERQVTQLASVQEVIRGDETLSRAVKVQMGPDQLERWCSGGE